MKKFMLLKAQKVQFLHKNSLSFPSFAFHRSNFQKVDIISPVNYKRTIFETTKRINLADAFQNKFPKRTFSVLYSLKYYRNFHISNMSINNTSNNVAASSTYSTATSVKTVACLIIGDEVLNGKTLDTNSNWLAKKCFESGLSLKRVVVIPDDKQDIIDHVQSLSKQFDFVLTSGGIGSTHDDITYECIGQAFNLPLEYHQETMDRMKRIMSKRLETEYLAQGKPLSQFVNTFELSESRKRMAYLPFDSHHDKVKVIFPCDHLWVPLVIVNKNIHILPGIPRLFKDLNEAYFTNSLLPSLPTTSTRRFTRKFIGTSCFESDIANDLRDIQKQADAYQIKIGSYPKWKPDHITSSNEWKLKVVVSVIGQDDIQVERFSQLIKEKIEGFDISND